MSTKVLASNVFLDNASSTVDEVMQFLAEKAVEAGAATDSNAVYEAFKAREAEGTTGMMGGFAIPHAKNAAISTPCVMVAKLANPVDWRSMDGEPITCVIALLIPAAEAAEHLAVLSRVAVLLMDEGFRANMLAATTADEVANLVNAGLEQEA